MNNYTVNFSSSGASTNSTTQSYLVVTTLDMCIYSLHFLFGLPTHCYVFWLIVTKTGSGVASEFSNLNLSVCEMIYCLDSLFSVLCFKYFSWLTKLVDLTWFLLGLGITGRPVFQCLICVERYLAVVHPVIYMKYKPLRYRVISCTMAWTLTLGSCLSLMFRLVLFGYYVFVCFFSIQFLLFSGIQLFCCLAVLRALKQSGPGDRRREEENHMKRRAFDLILISTVTMALIYVPFTVSGFSFILTGHYSGDVSTAVFFCFILVSFVQPVLYLHRNGKLSCLHFP